MIARTSESQRKIQPPKVFNPIKIPAPLPSKKEIAKAPVKTVPKAAPLKTPKDDPYSSKNTTPTKVISPQPIAGMNKVVTIVTPKAPIAPLPATPIVSKPQVPYMPDYSAGEIREVAVIPPPATTVLPYKAPTDPLVTTVLKSPIIAEVAPKIGGSIPVSVPKTVSIGIAGIPSQERIESVILPAALAGAVKGSIAPTVGVPTSEKTLAVLPISGTVIRPIIEDSIPVLGKDYDPSKSDIPCPDKDWSTVKPLTATPVSTINPNPAPRSPETGTLVKQAPDTKEPVTQKTPSGDSQVKTGAVNKPNTTSGTGEESKTPNLSVVLGVSPAILISGAVILFFLLRGK